MMLQLLEFALPLHDGERLREARRRAHLSQRALGRMIGRSESYVCRRESDEVVSSEDRLAIAAALPVLWAQSLTDLMALPPKGVFPPLQRDGSRLRGARLAARLTQVELSERLGVDQSQVCRWESRGYITAASRACIAGALYVVWARPVRVTDVSLASGNTRPPRELAGKRRGAGSR